MTSAPDRLITMLNKDCLLEIIKHVAATEDEEERFENFLSLSRSCKKFNKLARSELYGES